MTASCQIAHGSKNGPHAGLEKLADPLERGQRGMQQPEEEGKHRQAGKDPESEITQAPLQIAKQRLPEQKGQHRPRKKER